MSTWLEAHRLANLAAAQTHGDLNVDPAHFPVDVFGAIGEADVMLIWRPLPRLFGAYLDEPDSRPGIILNNGLSHAAQRQTAAHELGHHVLGHGTRTDLDLDPFTERHTNWSDVEKAAEAFASWFLMPRRAMAAAMARLGLERLTQPAEVYRLSLLLGTPYRSTLRHLPNVRLASQALTRSWMSVPPGRIKAGLDPAPVPTSREPDVWVVGPALTGLTLSVRPSDRLIIELADSADRVEVGPGVVELATRTAAAPGMRGAPSEAARRVPFEVGATPGPAEHTITVRSSTRSDSWAVQLKVEGHRSGIARRWVT